MNWLFGSEVALGSICGGAMWKLLQPNLGKTKKYLLLLLGINLYIRFLYFYNYMLSCADLTPKPPASRP